MAKKIVNQEPCIFCGAKPCECKPSEKDFKQKDEKKDNE